MRHLISAACVLTLLASATLAQQQSRPVDQNVADLDQLSTSHRVFNHGLRHDGEHSSMYQVDPQDARQVTGLPVAPTHQQTVYHRVAPGYSAMFNRSDYVVRSKADSRQLELNVAARRDGEFVELIPPNTVFLLSPMQEQPRTPEPEANPARLDLRVDGRVDRRVDTMVDRRVDNRVTDDTHARYGRADASPNRPDGHYFVGRRSYDHAPIRSLSIRRTSSTRPATNAATPPVSDGSRQSN